jgi:hypothetical protein
MNDAKSTRTPWRMLAVLAVGALLTFPSIAASKGGGGGKTKTTGSQTCAVTPNPVANGTQYTISGTGYKPAQMLDVFSGDGGIVFAQANGDGAFSTWDRASFLSTGTKTVNVYEMGDRHMSVLATCKFDVY